MIKNYLKIAWRQLRKQKMYSAIKIGGFAFSIAACLLIGLYIRNEMSYDQAYPDTPLIYRVVGSYNDNGTVNKGTDWPAPLGKALYSFSQVESVGRLMPNNLFDKAGSNEVRRTDRTENAHEEGFVYADQQMLDILKLPMVYGNRKHALDEPLTMVITKKKADKYFPGQNPLGKLMYLNDDKKKPYRVTGVLQNLPPTMHLQYDFWLTLNGVEFYQGEQNNWGASNYPTYVLVRPGTDIQMLGKEMTKVIMYNYYLPTLLKDGVKNARQEVGKFSIFLQPVSDINLHSYDISDELKHGDIRFIWLFGAIAVFILIIACINFVNLSTAKSANRAKEVGLRKVVGSQRSGLIYQFLSESLLYSVFSFILGLFLAWLLLPYFNTLASKSLTMPWGEWWLIPTLVVAAIIVGVAAGLYPAFYLSGFKPAQVLKGSISNGSKSSALRNGLVIFQFTTSIILIISTIVIYNQMQYILNRKIGFDKDQVVIIQGTNTLGESIKNFKNELMKIASVKSASISDYLPVEGTKRNGNTFYNEGKTKTDAGISTQKWEADDTYIKTMGMKLVEGRNFSYAMAADSQSVIINQTLAGKLNLKNPIGKKITNGFATFTVIGVVKDFNFETMRDHIGALVLHFGISPSLVTVKVKTTDIKNTLQSITNVWRTFSPNQPVRYTFLDESFASMYADVQRMGRIFTTFGIIAIIIACLGLFALSAFMAEQRSKEIGIRKVLGATVSGITTLLSLDFIKLVAIAILIASPIGWWGMNKWLQQFAYRINVEWWVFVLAGLASVMIAVLTVSFQSVKAALMSPVKSLKSE